MYAIVDIAGQQLKVEKNQKVFVNRLEGKEGSKVSFDQVLLIHDDGKTMVGTPVVKNMVVSATIISHLKGDKVHVFKKKRRKGYKVHNGHRQFHTELLIDSIKEGKSGSSVKVKSESKPETASPKKSAEISSEKPKAAAKETKKPTANKSVPASKKETPAKSTPEKKASAPKAVSKKEEGDDTMPKVKKAPAKKKEE